MARRPEPLKTEKPRNPTGWRGLFAGKDGANSRDRTDDLRITNALLYQLSYIGGKRTSIYHFEFRQVKHRFFIFQQDLS